MSVHEKNLPPEITISLVESLYHERMTFAYGAVVSCAGIFVSAWLSGSTPIYICGLAMCVVVMARSWHFRYFATKFGTVRDVAAAERWKNAYGVGAGVYVTMLGVWCLLAFAFTDDQFSQLFSLATALAILVGVTGRNFAIASLVDIQIAGLAVPMLTGLILSPLWYHQLLAVFLLPFFGFVRRICARLRGILLEALTANRANKLLADRFDAALNNMPIGLTMFDADGALCVVNRRWPELVGFEPVPGGRFTEAFNGFETEVDERFRRGPRLEKEFARCLVAGGVAKSIVHSESRTLDVTMHPVASGGVIVLAEDVTERHQAQARIAQMAKYDVLTGLLNRASVQARIDEAVERSASECGFALHFIDLDYFKQVNDTLGHAVGDALLFEVASRLRRVVAEDDVVGRFGGDEFVIVQFLHQDVEEAGVLAARLIADISEPYELESQQIVVGASVGIAVATRDGADPDTLFKHADMALYRAKAEGRGVHRFYEASMDVRARERREIEIDLRTAVKKNELVPYFQPLYDVKAHRIAVMEALLRWPHPKRGMVSPGVFVPIAEDIGLIVEIGDQILRRACQECQSWPEPTKVAVNLSPIQFSRGDVVESVRAALAASGLAPERLEVEITESVLLDDASKAVATLEKLRAMGVRIALDDFGTGYSSLSYLHDLPLHKVKIDRSFVRELGSSTRSRTMMLAIARLSAELGLKVAVEGVETYEQLTVVADSDFVDEVQGYLFCRPMSAQDASAMLRRQLGEIPLSGVSQFETKAGSAAGTR